MEIKDSGKRRTFDTGAVRDIQVGKGRYDLIPWEAIHELALHCEQGAIKYGERNCEKGLPMHSLLDSAIRHLSRYMQGHTDEPHLRAAMWNIAMAIRTEKLMPEMQDIPVRMGKKNMDIIIIDEFIGREIDGNEEEKEPISFYPRTNNIPKEDF